MTELFRLDLLEKDVIQNFRLLPPDMKHVFLDILLSQVRLRTGGDENVVPFVTRQAI